jgi:DNA-directed RNA polymerase sigma subunit (sigma70/sigma32)
MAATKMKRGLKDYLLLLSTFPEPDAASLAERLRLSRQGDAGARRLLVESLLPKVLSWVSARRGEGLDFQELIALGNCAMIEFVKSYRGPVESLEDEACAAVLSALDTALKMGA